jgi:hypothetical protein
VVRGRKLDVAVNCGDRRVEAGHGEQVAFHWEGEPGDSRTITYAELLCEVCQADNALTEPPTCLGCTGRAGLGDLASRRASIGLAGEAPTALGLALPGIAASVDVSGCGLTARSTWETAAGPSGDAGTLSLRPSSASDASASPQPRPPVLRAAADVLFRFA